MAWYCGTITEAIAETKRSSKLFIVYITGNNEESQQMDVIWEKNDIKDLCQSDCICLKLNSDSVGCKQFSQMYPVLLVPFTYIFAVGGTPLEILAGVVDENDLKEKIEKAIQGKTQTLSNPSTSQTSLSPSQTEHNEQQGSVSTSTASPEQVKEQTANTSLSAQTTSMAYSDDDIPPEPSKVDNEPNSSLSASEKAKILQEKINQRRREKEEEVKKSERMKEIARRTTGKQIQEMKEKHQDMKRKLEIEERRKEEILKKEALERVREQIKRDREEKQKKYQKETEARRTEKEKVLKEKFEKEEKAEQEKSKMREKISRIQFRFPDGSTLTRQYDSSFTLAHCCDDLQQEAGTRLPADYELFTTLPNRVFNEEDMETSLIELGLVPSVALCIRPKKSEAAQQQVAFFSQLISFVLMLLSFPFNVLKTIWSFFTGASSSSTKEQSTRTDFSSKYDSSGNAERLRRRHVGGGSRETVRDGKMHRLHDIQNDDDEDDATWNGNSTQQM